MIKGRLSTGGLQWEHVEFDTGPVVGRPFQYIRYASDCCADLVETGVVDFVAGNGPLPPLPKGSRLGYSNEFLFRAGQVGYRLRIYDPVHARPARP